MTELFRYRWYLLAGFILGLLLLAPLGRQSREGPARFGDWYILEADLHTHSFLAGAFPLPWEIVLQGRYHNLDVVGVTEHNSLVGAKMARSFAKLFFPDMIVLAGEEVTTQQHHILLLGLKEFVSASKNPNDIIDAAEKQGAVSLLAHPVRKFWPSYDKIAHRVTGSEVITPGSRYGQESADNRAREESGWLKKFREKREAAWDWRDVERYYQKVNQKRKSGGLPPLTATANSDYHGLTFLGVVRTIIFTRDFSEAGVLDALKRGQALAWSDKKMIGPPQLQTLLTESGYQVRGSNYNYQNPAGLKLVTAFLFLLMAFFYYRRAPRWFQKRAATSATTPNSKDQATGF